MTVSSAQADGQIQVQETKGNNCSVDESEETEKKPWMEVEVEERQRSHFKDELTKTGH